MTYALRGSADSAELDRTGAAGALLALGVKDAVADPDTTDSDSTASISEAEADAGAESTSEATANEEADSEADADAEGTALFDKLAVEAVPLAADTLERMISSKAKSSALSASPAAAGPVARRSRVMA